MQVGIEIGVFRPRSAWSYVPQVLRIRLYTYETRVPRSAVSSCSIEALSSSAQGSDQFGSIGVVEPDPAPAVNESCWPSSEVSSRTPFMFWSRNS